VVKFCENDIASHFWQLSGLRVMAEPLGVFLWKWSKHVAEPLGIDLAKPLMMGFIFPIGFENCEEIKM